jgi:hypothetical protein
MEKRTLHLVSTVGLAASLFVGAFNVLAASSNDSVEHCKALVGRFNSTDVSHVTAEQLEVARRQAVYGEKLCISRPELGVKAVTLALNQIGVQPE